jgi:hypothetical protein
MLSLTGLNRSRPRWEVNTRASVSRKTCSMAKDFFFGWLIMIPFLSVVEAYCYSSFNGRKMQGNIKNLTEPGLWGKIQRY